MKNVLLTGATGFVGSHILEYFSIYALDEYRVIPAYRSREKLPKIYDNKARIGDLQDEEYVETLISNVEVVCHTAAFAELNGTVQDSVREFLEPTLKLIDEAKKQGVKRFVFLSAVTSKPIEENRLNCSLPLEKIWAHYASIMKIEAYLKEVSDEKFQAIIVRAGYFIGKNYSLGLLPILLPRLKTHLVPWKEQGKISLPLIDGADVAQALILASTVMINESFSIIEAVGKEIPSNKEVLVYLHEKHGYPLPHFSISSSFAYTFARTMRVLYKVLPFDPFIVPSVVLLMEETNASNEKAKELLGYEAKIPWKESIDVQVQQMKKEQKKPMRMNKK